MAKIITPMSPQVRGSRFATCPPLPVVAWVFWLALVSLVPLAHAVTFTTNVVIAEGDTTYDGQDIIVDGATATINGAHSFSSMSLTNGAVLTRAACTASVTHKLEIEVTGTLSVDATSKIDVIGKGYLPGRTTGNTTVGAATGSSAGSYGDAVAESLEDARRRAG